VIYEHGEPRWNVNRKIPHSSTRQHWQFYQQSSGSKQEDQLKGMMNLALKSILLILACDSFTGHKILHGVSGFTYLLKEGVLQIFIALKNPSP
jgi:hypothetical protein